MPVDSRDKRFSLMTLDWTVGRVLPQPDGTISTADRLHYVGKYRGIAANAPNPVVAVAALRAIVVRGLDAFRYIQVKP